ncbi:fibronectin type III domain protein [Ancylostoma caninum]|uniref:Fibronectin type III domain protein n=1 Tax=Ancylostoma caninum TaxID=29170 RepID=A0A368EYA7_ANCCA|nr:fibronectin type III domain protein [Ancylostoma caninum]
MNAWICLRFGYPSAPRSLQAVAVTPDTVYLYWNLPETLNAPISEIKYKVSQQASGLSSPSSIAVQEYMNGVFSPTTSDSASCLVSPCRVKIANLRPATEYKFWVIQPLIITLFLLVSDECTLVTFMNYADEYNLGNVNTRISSQFSVFGGF